MKLFGMNFGKARLAAPGNPFVTPQVGVSPESQGLVTSPSVPLPAGEGGEGNVLSPLMEKQPPVEEPPRKQGIYLNPRWEPINISQNATAQSVQTAIREAENGETRELFRFYRDALLGDDHIQQCFNARKICILSEPISIMPADKNNPDDVIAASACRRAVQDCENWTRATAEMMSSFLWPVTVTERLYRPADAPLRGEPKLTWTLRKFEAVNPMLFCFRWSYLTGGIAMGTASPMQQAGLGLTAGNFMVDLEMWEPFFKLWPIDNSGRIIYDAASAEYLDRRRHIVHRGHLLTEYRDNWGGPFRAILGWWLLRQLGRDWWAAFMQRYGMPFLKGKTNVEDEEAIRFLHDAFQMARRIGGLVIGHEDEVELCEAMVTGGAEGHERWVNFCNSAISTFICGQEMSSTSKSSGNFGDEGKAKLQGIVRDDVRKFDQVRLAETIEKQIFDPLLALNGLAGHVKATWGGLSPEESLGTGAVLVQLANAGLEVTDDSIPVISDRLGFTVQRAARSLGMEPDLQDGKRPAGAPDATRGGARAPGKQFGGGAPEGTGAAQLRAPTLSVHLPAGEGGHPSDAITARKAAALAVAYRGAMAPVARIIEDSASPEEAQANLAAYFRDWKPDRVRAVCEEALQLCAAAALEGKR
jgi:phage gp29-like protein